ncbi:inactive CLIP domain-containing serine protease A8-like [Oratosquilla oratoria]|uniref:inactive CLIP domain-containing serine protease A8-like n=1 Tax=Oratosquilla oratoria TaxID=337810 RepID=UPI003F77763B
MTSRKHRRRPWAQSTTQLPSRRRRVKKREMKFVITICFLVTASSSAQAAKLNPCLTSFDCVPTNLCHNGVINSDGTGLIDIRVKSTQCTNPEFPHVESVCCRIPGQPEPLTHCPAGKECVYPHLCKPDGTINTDGTGLIGLRTLIPEPCIIGKTEVGVCCIPPTPTVETCPTPLLCLSQCNGQALDHLNQLVPYTQGHTLWTQCPLGAGHSGVCCHPQVPSLDVCPESSVCLPGSQCLGDAYDYTSTWAPYNPEYQFWSTCNPGTVGGAPGVCCQLPPIQACPGESFCLVKELCTGQALDHSNQFVPYDFNQGSWPTCPLQELGFDGVCCLFPASKKYPVASQCGVRNDHVVEIDTRITLPNDEAKFGEFPWQAIIFFRNYTFKCGATLVGDKWLLTAAHCVYGLQPGDIHIRLGEWQVNTFDEPLPYEDFDVTKITIHPDYKPGPVFNDVAVLELVSPISYKYHINSVCVVAGGLGNAEPYVGRRCWASGWGKDAFNGNFQHILKKVDLPIVAHSHCQALLRRTRLGRFFRLHESFLCAGGEVGKDVCRGDGGGPLVCEEKDGTYTLVGITAWGIGCGERDVPGVYAYVGHAHQFVTDVLSGYAIPITYY